jgi:flagellar hook-basal body complex protein FliE
VQGFQDNATNSVNKFLSGEGEELHTVALATQQADISFQLFMQVRNKIVTAYNQVMQMQV